MNTLKITKNSGEIQQFSIMKLQRSLESSGLSPKKSKEIAMKIRQKCREGLSSKKLRSMAYKLIKKENRILASRYSMTKAITELGPDGYHFEKFICSIFNKQGNKASTNHILEGHCVEHEIDVKIEGKKTILCECKFHNNPNSKNDVKTALYVQARAEDLRNNIDFDEFWLISNTKFSKDAITYANCVGLKLLSPNAPSKQALSEFAIRYRVFPISVLTSLKKNQAKALIKTGCLFVHTLSQEPEFLNQIELEKSEQDLILLEARSLLR